MKITKVVGGVFIAAGAFLIAYNSLVPNISDAISAREQVAFANSAVIEKPTAAAKQQALPVGKVFAKLYVPRFGKSYVHAVAEGTSLNLVLNRVGIGHYQATQMPGQIGNFAIAGHRAGNGGPFRYIDTFKAGDLAYVVTADSWFTFRYLQTKVVDPSDIGVIYPNPVGLTAATEAKSFLTLTSCTPIHVNTKRIVAWFELVSQQPLHDGPPAGLRLSK